MNILVNVPLERQLIEDTKTNRYWLDYFRESYEQFIGVSTATIKKQLYTLEEQIERYSKNLAYWYIQLELEKTESHVNYPNDIQPKSEFIKSQITRLLNIIKDIFPPIIPPTIHEKAIDIKNNTRIIINKSLRTCSRCHSTKLESGFGINAKGEFYKSCDKCRKKRRDIKEELTPKPDEIKSTERKLEYMRQYLQDNKDRLNERRNQKIECECGSTFSKQYKYLHLRTQQHKAYIKSLEETNK